MGWRWPSLSDLGVKAIPRTFLRKETTSDMRDVLELGDSATKDVGTTAGTVAAGDHTHSGTYQPLNSDLTAIAGLSPSNDDILQRKSGAWTNRTIAQYVADLVAAGLLREKLTAARKYYVRTDGNDSNTGLANTAGGAFLTVQKAVDVASALDNGGYDITIQVGAGTYTAGVTFKSFVGSGRIILVGDETTPSNVVVSTTSASAIVASNGLGSYAVRGFKLQTTTSGSGLVVNNDSTITTRNMDFGAVVSSHISVTSGGRLTIDGNYSITGSANRHWDLDVFGSLICTTKTITLTGTPAFASAFLFMNTNSTAAVGANAFSGSATGTRYSVTGSICNVAGGSSTYLPGNVAGATGTGGFYF